jgi:hypothetical protein
MDYSIYIPWLVWEINDLPSKLNMNFDKNTVKWILNWMDSNQTLRFFDKMIDYIRSYQVSDDERLFMFIKSFANLQTWVNIDFRNQYIFKKYIDLGAKIVLDYPDYPALSEKIISLYMNIGLIKWNISFHEMERLGMKLIEKPIKYEDFKKYQ